ncbi:hypothetical protein ACFV0L_01935 [Streptosporangium canum]|uniref:hypothetical protein n=1 Tax=Streptosporangium canum TaxID=324952 RepID=UPI0036C0FB4E
MSTLQMAIADGMTITKRNALKIKRAPDLLGGAIILPIVFVPLATRLHKKAVSR